MYSDSNNARIRAKAAFRRAPSQKGAKSKGGSQMSVEAKSKPASDQPETLLKRKDLERLFQVSGATILKWVANAQLPAPIIIGNSYRWQPEVVTRFLSQRAQATRISA
jgi:predicted DNA-binding transcriptional regulator AlpA